MPVQLSTSLAVGLRELSLFVNWLVQLIAQTFNSLLKLLLLEYCFGECVLHNSFSRSQILRRELINKNNNDNNNNNNNNNNDNNR